MGWGALSNIRLPRAGGRILARDQRRIVEAVRGLLGSAGRPGGEAVGLRGPWAEFRPVVRYESGAYKGYVGHGHVFGPAEVQQAFAGLDVTHNGERVDGFYWETAAGSPGGCVANQIAEAAGEALSASTTYYTFLELTCREAGMTYAGQVGSVGSNGYVYAGADGFVIVEIIEAAEIVWKTSSYQTDSAANTDLDEIWSNYADPEGGYMTRYLGPLAQVVTGSGGAAEIHPYVFGPLTLSTWTRGAIPPIGTANDLLSWSDGLAVDEDDLP